MIILLPAFLFGIGVKPVYNTSFKNEVLDVSYKKDGFPIFVSTPEDIYSLDYKGKKIFHIPRTGIFSSRGRC